MVRVVNLTKEFKGAGIRNINFNLPENSIMTILGRSGSGKTVLMKTILGLFSPDKGYVEIDGINPHNVNYDELNKLREKFGVIFQSNALFDSMNVYENLMLSFLYTNISIKEKNGIIDEMLELVHLENAKDKYIKELSGGMQKRAAIARALVKNPELIFYDEPVTGLDPMTSLKITGLIQELSSKMNKTVIIITHDLREFVDFSNLFLILENGEQIFFGNRNELINFENDIAKFYLKTVGLK